MAIGDVSASLLSVTDRTAEEGSFAKGLNLDEPVGFNEIPCSDGALLLRLNQSALRRLDRLVRQATQAGPGGAPAAEAGGILLGSIAPDRSIVTLLDVMPVESAHRSGAAYRPSDADLRNFAEAIEQAAKARQSVIGYFRSHLGHAGSERGVSLRAEDEKLLRRFFTADGCSVMLVHAAQGMPSTAWFCQWHAGEEARLVQRLQLATARAPLPPARPTLRQVNKPAFERARPQAIVPVPANGDGKTTDRAATAERERSSPPETAPAVIEPRAAANLKSAAPPLQRQDSPAPPAIGGVKLPDVWRRHFKTIGIATGAVLALTAIFALGRLSAPVKPVPDAGVLDLSAEVHDLIVEVKWNAASPAIRDAERASLSVIEGAQVNRIELNGAQLRSGHYIVVPTRADLTCLMTVYRNQNAFVGATKSVHIDLPQTAGLPYGELPSSPLPAAAPAGKPLLAPPATTGTVASQKTEVASSTRADQKNAADENSARATSFVPPPVTARTAPAPRVEEPPDIAAASNSANPTVSAPRLPGSVTAPGSVVTPPRVAGNSPSPVYLDAVPVTRVNPALPQASPIEIRKPVSIRVAVQIDREGHVTGARAIEGTDIAERMLAPYAVQAARRWRFDPAVRDGVKVASETVVVFQFAQNM